MKTTWLFGLMVISANLYASEAEIKKDAEVNIDGNYELDSIKLQIIKKIGENVHPDNIVINSNLPVLATAVRYNDLGFTNVLCKLGANVNKIYNAGGWLEQPLIYAESLPMVQLLIDNKALPAGRESRVQDPLDDAQKNWSFKTPHMIAAWLIAGADPNRFHENSRCLGPLYAFGTLILSYHRKFVNGKDSPKDDDTLENMEKKIRYFIWAGVDKQTSSITDLSSEFNLKDFAAKLKEKPHRKKLLDLIADAEKKLPLKRQEFLEKYPCLNNKNLDGIIADYCGPATYCLALKVAQEEAQKQAQEKTKQNPKKS